MAHVRQPSVVSSDAGGCDSRPASPANRQRELSSAREARIWQIKWTFYCQTTSTSTAPCASRRFCCPSHCSSHCAPCQPPLRAFSGSIRFPPPTHMEHTRQSKPDPVLDFYTEVLKSLQVGPSSLGSVNGTSFRNRKGVAKTKMRTRTPQSLQYGG